MFFFFFRIYVVSYHVGLACNVERYCLGFGGDGLNGRFWGVLVLSQWEYRGGGGVMTLKHIETTLAIKVIQA